MRTLSNLKSLLIALFFFGILGSSYAQDGNREFYQLKIYSFENKEQVQTTDTYLSEAFLPALKEIGISPVGVFKEHVEQDSILGKTYVLIPLKSLDDFLALENKLAANELHNSKGNGYLKAAHDNPPYQRIESTLMKAFIDMPKMATPKLEGPRSERIYELRSYESATEHLYVNKVDMFNAGGEVPLFDDLGFNAVFYGEVLSGANMPNLMYMTTHENTEARTANWKAFVDSPVWAKLKVRPEYQNNVSKNTQYMLYPTEYSDY